MRELIFKNLTSQDKRKKIIVSSEQVQKSGIRTHTIRRLICLIREIKPQEALRKSLPYLYVLKERNHKQKSRRFFCRIKGSIYATNNGCLYLISFVHSLKINLKVLSSHPAEYLEGNS